VSVLCNNNIPVAQCVWMRKLLQSNPSFSSCIVRAFLNSRNVAFSGEIDDSLSILSVLYCLVVPIIEVDTMVGNER
jgi:hypothetical protein